MKLRVALGLSIAATLSMASACEVLLPAAISWAAGMLKSSGDNYGEQSKEQLSELLLAFSKRAEEAEKATPSPAQPAARPAAAKPQLALDVALHRQLAARGLVGGNAAEASFRLTTLQANPVLRDGHDRDGHGDQLRISFRPSRECWVYVIEVDATGWATPVFPNPDVSSKSNPVSPDATVLVPDGDDPFGLDQHRGQEHFFFLASDRPRPDIEQILEQLRARGDRPKPKGATVRERVTRSRGIQGGSAKQATVATTTGSSTRVDAATWLARKGEGEILVTLPFQHR